MLKDSITVSYINANISNKYIFRKNIKGKILLEELEIETGVPKEAIVLYIYPYVLLIDELLVSPYVKLDIEKEVDVDILMKIRPLVGDHTHIIHSFWVYTDNTYKLISPLGDIFPITEYEPEVEREPGFYYLLNGLNAGVHTHSDGLIHVHPFTAPSVLINQSEGLNSTLKLYFPVIGVNYKSIDDKFSLQFNKNVNLIKYNDTNSKSGYTYVSSDFSTPLLFEPTIELQWYLFVWSNYKDFLNKKLPKIYTNDVNNIWVFKNGSVFIFGYFPKDKVINNIPNIIRNKVYTVTSGQISEFIKYHVDNF